MKRENKIKSTVNDLDTMIVISDYSEIDIEVLSISIETA